MPPGASACGRVAAARWRCSSSSGSSRYPVVFIFGLIAAARRRRGVDGPGLERAGLGRRRLQRRRPRPHRPPARVPGARRHRRRHHRLLVQPHHAVPVEDRRRPSPSALIAVLVLAVGFIFAFRPSLQVGADRHRRRDRRPRARRRRRRPPRSSGEREIDPHETTGDLARRRRVRHRPRRPRPTRTPRRRCRQGQPRRPSRSCATDGTLVADNARHRRATRTTLVVTRANPTNVLFLNESGEDGASCSTSAPGPRSTRPATRSTDTRCRPALHGPRRGRRRAADDVLDPDSRARSPTAPYVHRPGCRRRRGREWSCREAAPGRAAARGVVGRRDRRRWRAAGRPPPAARPARRRLRRGRPAGHVAAGRAERPEDPEPAVAGVRHRRRRRLSSCSPPSVRASSATATAASRSPSRPTASRRSRSALTILPALILIGVAIPTVGTLLALAKTDDTECFVNVTGQQWWWEIDYPVQDGCGGIDRADRHQRPDGHPDRHQRARPRHQPRRDPQLVDPAAQRQARHGARPRADGAHRGRRAGHLRRPVHRVLRALPRQHAHGGRRPVAGRLRDVEGQPAGAVRSPRPRAPWPPRASRRSSRSARAATRSTGSMDADGVPGHRRSPSCTCTRGRRPTSPT